MYESGLVLKNLLYVFVIVSGRGHIPPSPVRRKNHEVQRSPIQKPNPSPHHHQPLTSDGLSTGHHMTSNVSPRHQIMRGADNNLPGGFTGAHGTMPTLLEEEEERSYEVGGVVEGSEDGGVFGVEEEEEEGGNSEEEARGEGGGGVEERSGEEREEKKTEEGEEEEGGEENENEGEEQRTDEGEIDAQYPVSSTPASKTPDPPLVKTDSFSEYLRAGESDGCSLSSLISLPEGLFEGFIRHKDGSSIDVVFQVCVYILAG